MELKTTVLWVVIVRRRLSSFSLFCMVRSEVVKFLRKCVAGTCTSEEKKSDPNPFWPYRPPVVGVIQLSSLDVIANQPSIGGTIT